MPRWGLSGDGLSEKTGEQLETVIQNAMTEFNLVKDKPIKYGNYETLARTFYEKSGEYTVMSAIQSRLAKTITPNMIVLTNKKVIMLEPSYSHVHWNKRFFSGGEIEELVTYNQIADVKLHSGRILASITLRIVGLSDTTKISGLPYREAKTIAKVIEYILQH